MRVSYGEDNRARELPFTHAHRVTNGPRDSSDVLRWVEDRHQNGSGLGDVDGGN